MANRDLKKFNKLNCKVLYLRMKTPVHQYRLGKEALQKDLGLGEHQTKHEPAMHSCSNEGQQSPGQHQGEYCQQVKGVIL